MREETRKAIEATKGKIANGKIERAIINALDREFKRKRMHKDFDIERIISEAIKVTGRDRKQIMEYMNPVIKELKQKGLKV